MHNPLRISKSTLPLVLFTTTVLGGISINTKNINKTNQIEITATKESPKLNKKKVADYGNHNTKFVGTNLAMCLLGLCKRKKPNNTAAIEENQMINTEKTVLNNNHHVTLYYTGNNVLTKRMEEDELGRFVDKQVFDSDGNLIEHMHKDYFENLNTKGHIEYYKGKGQEYSRKVCNTYNNEEMHYIEEFNSITQPECNYKMESIYTQGKLVKIIQNGEVIFNANP